MEEDIRFAAVADTPEGVSNDGSSADENVGDERDRLTRQAADLRDQLLRTRAEFENYRKRRDREQLEFAEYAGMEMVRVFLPAIDDFERALKASEETDRPSEFTKGVELIYSRLLDALKKQGLEPIVTEGQKFDPNLHHAIKMVQDNDLEDHTILQEYQRGYKFKSRMLRPAMVEVSVHS